MRVKGWIVIALAVTVVGSGTGILAQAMTDKYEREVTKIVSSGVAKSATDSAVKTDVSDEVQLIDDDTDSAVETETKVIISTENRDFPIKKEFDKFTVKKTKADMSMEDAVTIAVKMASEIFGGLTVEEVTGVDLCEPEVLHEIREGEEEEGYYRAYCGNIICKEDYAVYFEVDSINGKVNKLEKVVNQNDKAYDDALICEKVDRKIQKEKNLYDNIAETFVSKYLETEKKIECICVGSDSLSLKAGRYKCHRIAASAACQASDDTLYHIWIDPKEKEVIGFSTTWSDNFRSLDDKEEIPNNIVSSSASSSASSSGKFE